MHKWVCTLTGACTPLSRVCKLTTGMGLCVCKHAEAWACYQSVCVVRTSVHKQVCTLTGGVCPLEECARSWGGVCSLHECAQGD